MRARVFGAVCVNVKRVFVNLKAAFFSGLMLQDFDVFIAKLFNTSALHANNVVVMLAVVKLKNSFSTFKMVAYQ
jgi:hypothetical protein